MLVSGDVDYDIKEQIIFSCIISVIILLLFSQN